MGERGPIASRSIATAGVAFAALLLPAGAAAHPAYVDRDTNLPEDPQCALPTAPCKTIAEGIAQVESGLQVIVDDSPAPYTESVTIGSNRALVSQDFAGGAEGQWTIDGETESAVTVRAGELGTVVGFNLRSEVSAVSIQGAATVANNTFDDPDQAASGDVQVLGPGPTTITQNEFTDADLIAPDTAIRIGDGSASASLSRNSVSGYATAVDVGDTTGAVTLSSDLLFGNAMGLEMNDVPPTGTGQADASATNVTLWDNGTDVSNTDAHLVLDSSILEQPVTAIGTASCAIAYSRGPLVGTGCAGFTTADDPQFDPLNAYHLVDGSPMIDAGNPAQPLSRDIDGDLRALDGNGACPAERDIGADEFVVMGTPLDCSPPPDPQPQPQFQPGDTAPPETVVSSGPSGKTKSTSASFTFTSTEPGSTFECSLDGGSFQPCTSPHSVKVKKGGHSLEVRARDAAGNRDSTPASWSWTVKKKKKKK